MPRRLNVDLPSVNDGCDYAPLTEKADIFPYENNRKVSDTPIGVKLTLALQGARLAPLVVKFDHDPLPDITDEQIEAACLNLDFIYVQIPNCTINLYSSNSSSDIGMNGTAQTAKIVTLKSDK